MIPPMTEFSLHHYPVMLNLRGKRCVVVGGGKIAFQKIKNLIGTGADIVIISPVLSEQLTVLVTKHNLNHINRKYEPGDLKSAYLVFGATGDANVNAAVYNEAIDVTPLVNIVDTPELCHFQVPSMIIRESLVVSFSTSGRAPALSKWLRKYFEKEFGPEFTVFVNWIEKWRVALKKMKILNINDREHIFIEILNEDTLNLLKTTPQSEAFTQLDRKMGKIIRQILKDKKI